jgi:hypothetical protein
MGWSSRLRHPIALADGRVLETLSDARDMVLSLPEGEEAVVMLRLIKRHRSRT